MNGSRRRETCVYWQPGMACVGWTHKQHARMRAIADGARGVTHRMHRRPRRPSEQARHTPTHQAASRNASIVACSLPHARREGWSFRARGEARVPGLATAPAAEACGPLAVPYQPRARRPSIQSRRREPSPRPSRRRPRRRLARGWRRLRRRVVAPEDCWGGRRA